MKVTRKRIALLVGTALVLTLLFTFKIEQLEDTCANTGSQVRYERYFSLFTTKKRLTPSWIETALEEEGITLPARDWVRTTGDTRTAFGLSHGHARAPAVYYIRSLPPDVLWEERCEDRILSLAKAIAFGEEEERKRAIERALR